MRRLAVVCALAAGLLVSANARAETWQSYKASHPWHLKPLVLSPEVTPGVAVFLIREYEARSHAGRARRWKAWARANPPVTTYSPPTTYGPYEQMVVDIIHDVFGVYGDEAVAVATCESGLRTTARNGQYWGIFQMGEYARGKYGYGDDALTQVTTAYAYFADSGYDWSPWECKP